MLEAANKARELISGITMHDLEDDEVRTLAVIHLLEILGEAASGVSPDMKAAHPELPWTDITDTRNRLIHGYFDIDLSIVWKVTTEDLPPVIDVLRDLVEDE